MSQCPVFGNTIDSAFTATNLTCFPKASPFACAPPMERTGMVSFVRAKRAKSSAAR